MTWAKLWYLRSNPQLVSSRGPSGLLAAEVAELAGYVVAQRPRAALAGEIGHRQQVPTGRRWRTVVPSWMLCNMVVTSSMRPLRANKDQKRPGTAGL